MLCVMMLPLVVVGCTSAVCQSVREAATASGVDKVQPPPDWTLRRDYFRTRRRLITMQKQLEGTRSILMSSADRVAHIDGQLMQLLSNTHALPARYKMPKVIKPSNPFTNVCWVSVLTTFSAPPQILAASTVFFCEFQKRRNDGWWFSAQCFLLPVCFER